MEPTVTETMPETERGTSDPEVLVMSTVEAGEICRVSASTVRNWIEDEGRTDRLPAYRLPGRLGAWRVRENDLRAFMTRHGLPLDRLNRWARKARAAAVQS